MSKIDRLTPEQEALIPVIRDMFIEYGLKTGPSDRKTAEDGVRRAYEQQGLPPPQEFVWLKSPLEGMLAANMAVHGEAEHRINETYPGSGEWTINKDGYNRAPQWVQPGYGQHDVSWLSSYYFFHQIGCKGLEKIIPLVDIAKSTGWWWPFENACFMTERPIKLEQDEQGRLHCEDDMALKYPDGTGVYSFHGVAVPEKVILKPESVTAQEIDDEQNAEVRRVMIERVGISRYVTEGGFEVLHEDKDSLGHPRRLLAKKRDDEIDVMVVEVTNSTAEADGTRKVYHLRVHPELRPLLEDNELGPVQKPTCHNAVASTFGMTGDEYHPEVET